MKNKWLKLLFCLILLFSLVSFIVPSANAATVMWGKTELKLGQIGKVTISADTKLVKLEKDGSLSTVRPMKKDEEYRVYSFKSNHGGLYGVGGGSFVQKNAKVKYETPSKSKLALLQQQGQVGKDMKVHFIDVGQGDSILIQSPNGKTMLIDGGTKSDGDTIVAYLKSLKVSKLDYVVATHPDADHIGGLIDVVNSFTIVQFINSGKVHTTQTYEELLSIVLAKNIKYSEPKTGDSIPLDSAIKLQVLHVDASADDNNDASIVLKATYNNISFLLTGDAAADIESKIMAKYDVKATVLKAGHHGSNTSSSARFINAVKPTTTILSYGKDNSYGHPHAEVVANLKNVSSKIYSTATSGNIVVITNGTTHSVSAKPFTDNSTGVVTPKPIPVPVKKPVVESGLEVIPGAPNTFKNCTAMREYYPNGVKNGHPAYASKHDRDKDNWACDR
ncbi:MBL fold metallo-hydrolase [Psychrobacillus psychrotolerans]|uniref:MBL fold metallo-hydrolase n=1 Tax=Psychrobacillus psychrotolerans TaxID=126156 RepID=UPI0033145F07